MAPKAFGSGNFGEWIEDEHHLPAYRYTCDQHNEPRAVTPTNPLWRSPTDHSHQVGNDRLVAVASNFGFVQVRQDEGGPKFLNDYDPPGGHFAGGFGYLTDGNKAISTYYPGDGGSFERVFGIGYYRKTVQGTSFSADQVIFAPFGDDPLLISQVTITNKSTTEANLRWVEYWGCQMYQFSHRAQVLSVISRGKKTVPGLRRELARRFSHQTSVTENGTGLIHTSKFLGYTFSQKREWALAQLILDTVAKKTTGGALKPPVKEASLEDINPPAVFLVSLDAPADGMSTAEATFFGKGGTASPDELNTPLPKALSVLDGSGMLLERRIRLAPGESKTVYFAYGYLPQGVEFEPLLEKYRTNPADLWKRSSEAWKAGRIMLEVPDEPWVQRELAWHNYYLRSDLTYDSFYKEHILSQGHVYQYIMGFQGAARDPLQHALPFIYSNPQVVKEVLRYTLKEVLPDGEIPYGVTGCGMRMAVPFKPSDQELWLLWLASEYILAWRDRDFLNEQITTFPLYGAQAGRATVGELLARCYQHLVTVTGVGKHGLMRLSNGDWNDGSVIGFVPKEQHEEVRQQGESVLNAAFATYTLDLYARMLAWAGNARAAGEAKNWAEGQRKAVRGQWTGKWFRRGWLSEKLGWIGEDVMWLEPQPWTIIGDAATPQQRQELVEVIDELVRKPSPIGAMLMSGSLEEIESAPGDLTNAGVWPSINGTLVWALALLDGKLAWEEWKKNSLAYHAESYPDTWYGIWSGPDVYNSVLSKYPGQTFFDEKALQGGESVSPLGANVNWTDFPVMNMHPHAWPLYDTVKLIGVEITPEGLSLAPALPHETFRFDAPLLGLEKTADGYRGWYAPSTAGKYQITLHLAERDLERCNRLEINGVQYQLQVNEQGAIQFSGESAPGKPLRWSVREEKGGGVPPLMKYGKMSSRERLLAALHRQPVDRLPFVPLIDTYSLLDMPDEIQQAMQAGANEGYWQGILAASRGIGCDIMLRHVYVTRQAAGAPHLNGFGQFMPPVVTSSRMEGSLLIETLETPVGTLTGTWGFTDAHGWIPHPIKHVVNNHDELKTFAYAVEHLSLDMPEPDFENYRKAEQALGETGLATTSFLNTPLMDLIETCWGLENTYYLLNDYPNEVEAILEQLHRVQRQVVRRIAESPALVVIEYENTSSTLLSPAIFRRYCLPVLNEYADILKSAGKIFLVHMCGKLKAFEAELAEAHFDGVADISPLPTGNFTLDEAAAHLPGKVIVGGIDATTFIEPDLQKVETRIAALIEAVKPYPGILLGSADTAPRGTPPETFRLIQHLVETVGSYRSTEGYHPGVFTPAGATVTSEAPRAKPEVTEVLNMQGVLEELARRLDGKRPEVSGTIRFDVSGDRIYRLFIDKGKCRLEASDGRSDAGMSANPKNLLALFTGKLNPMSAFMTRKIKFEGDLKLLGVLTAAAD